jgi:uncharacterized UBP type Zn finger protein
MPVSEDCTHLDQIDLDAGARAEGCEECLAAGGRWLHLRRCAVCGHIGCCDSSPGKHARRHWEETGHAVAQSFEPGEDWMYCFADDIVFEVQELEDSPSHP